jgi:hypothetical protein
LIGCLRGPTHKGSWLMMTIASSTCLSPQRCSLSLCPSFIRTYRVHITASDWNNSIDLGPLQESMGALSQIAPLRVRPALHLQSSTLHLHLQCHASTLSGASQRR